MADVDWNPVETVDLSIDVDCLEFVQSVGDGQMNGATTVVDIDRRVAGIETTFRICVDDHFLNRYAAESVRFVTTIQILFDVVRFLVDELPVLVVGRLSAAS